MNSEADNIIGLYQRHAQDWDKDRGRSLFERPWLERFLKLVPPGGSILDIGCGSSEPIARFLIEQGYEVTGVDSSPSLIDMCKRRFPLQKWVVADMRALRLDTIFNGIIAWDSFFHRRPEDQRLMFPRFRKHASAEAALLFTSGQPTGKQSANIEVNPCTTAVWMARPAANCWNIADLPLCSTSLRTLHVGITRFG